MCTRERLIGLACIHIVHVSVITASPEGVGHIGASRSYYIISQRGIHDTDTQTLAL